jgi:multiple sugar transport system substrate-binding protein
MFWLYSHAALGGGRHGPRPITELQQELWPDLRERFYESALQDVFWQGEFYGIPWRGDIRPMLYRTDFLEEAGLSQAPDTWEEITELALRLTQRDEDGNTLRWGFEFGSANPVQDCLPYYWQAGGEYMTADGKTATVDTPEMRTALSWMRDLIWEHRVVPPDFMEQGHAPEDLFVSGQVAIIGQAPGNTGSTFAFDFPEMEGLWAMSLPAKGPVNRASYSGSGYWGVLYDAADLRATAQWIEFLSRDQNMQRITEFTGHISPNKSVQTSAFWTDAPWKRVIGECMEHAHTSQHPSPAWSKVVASEAGAVLYDMFYEALIRQEPLDDVLARAQQRMQEEMDKIEI